MGHPSHEPFSNFDTLRIVAVGIVIVGNGLVLTGGVPPGLWGAPLPRIGLDLLFAISGYMAVGSLARNASPIGFILRRIRRLFPALAVSVLFTALVIGPMATTLPQRAYLLARETRHYLLNAVLLPHMFLPSTFVGQQWSGAANPMLWTLNVYAVGCGAIILVSRLRRSRQMWVALLLALLSGLPHVLQRPEMMNVLIELPFFFFGASLVFAEQRWQEAVWRADLAMLSFALTWIVATWVGEWTILVEWFTLPYMAACFGRMTLPGLAMLKWIGNPSLGMYLYAFPLQQLIVARLPGIAHPILLCLASATALGSFSWHLIEQPTIRLIRYAP